MACQRVSRAPAAEAFFLIIKGRLIKTSLCETKGPLRTRSSGKGVKNQTCRSWFRGCGSTSCGGSAEARLHSSPSSPTFPPFLFSSVPILAPVPDCPLAPRAVVLSVSPRAVRPAVGCLPALQGPDRRHDYTSSALLCVGPPQVLAADGSQTVPCGRRLDAT